MVLQMTRPFLHKPTGIYYFRKGIPKHLRGLFGGRWEEKVSLGTKDPAEARRRHAIVATEVDATWRKAMAAPVLEPDIPETPLAEKEVVALSGELYRETVKEHGDNPGRASVWQKKLVELQLALPERLRETGVKQPFRGQWIFGPAQVAGRLLGGDIDRFLESRGMRLAWQSRNLLCYHGALALAQAYLELAKRAEGDYRPDPDAVRFPELSVVADWKVLYEGYRSKRKPSAATVKRQLGVLRAFFGFLGHDNPVAVSDADIRRWIDHRLDLGISPRTIRDADIAHPRTLFIWARKNKKIPNSPFDDIEAPMVEAEELREREYTLEEAEMVLQASLVPAGSRMTVEGAAAHRWIPWICAYAGARVNEVTQARAADVFRRRVPDGRKIWVLRITPEAGSVKNRKARVVALHPHLIEQGFLDYVQSREGRHLFYDPSRGKDGSAAHPQYKKVGERLAKWVRKEVGITDVGVDPNHAWRHLFRSWLLAGGVQEQIINRIDGHAAKNVAQTYGSAWPAVMLEAVSKIPPYLSDSEAGGRARGGEVG